ncbi:MAG: MarR family transcriptional regulator [Deltaproteobacteria bacterium]|nr:MAG: MarR family transcriptional regulator [Deltaproteobacteria bacterium]
MHRRTDEEAERLRECLRDLLHTLQLFNDFETPGGEHISTSCATALILLHRGERTPPGALGPSLRELGDGLAIDKSNVTRLCQRMEESGHVRLVPCPDDGRVKRVVLTDSGRQLAVAVDTVSLSRFRMALDRLEPATRAEALRGFASIVVALQESAAEAVVIWERMLGERSPGG